MKKEVTEFKRQKTFENYYDKTNPFSFVTTKIDITNIYKLTRIKKHTYASIAYFLTKAMNRIEEFHYTYENGKIYYSDIIHPNFTDILDDNSIGFYNCNMKDDYDEFLLEFDRVKKSFLNRTYEECEVDDAVVWLSCQPWYNFTGLVSPFDKSITIPQLIWDKIEHKDGREYVNLMIMSHHGFVDGYHIGKLIEYINEEINNIETTFSEYFTE